MSENAINNKAMNTGKRKRFHEHGAQNDIKYRGPISDFGFQVLGWLCIVTGIAIVMMKLSIKVNPDMNARFETLVGILEYIPPMSLPSC